MELFKNMKKDRKKDFFKLTFFAILIFFTTYLEKIYGNSYFIFTAFLLIYIFLIENIFLDAIDALSQKNITDENFLISIASLLAFIMGHFSQACIIIFLYNLGQIFIGLSNDRINSNIKEIIDIVPKKVNKLNADGSLAQIDIRKIKVGDIILAKDGEKIAVDGIVLDGEGLLDTSFLTGKAMPEEVRKNSKILSSSVLKTGMIKYRAESIFDESIARKVIDIIKDSFKKKSDSEKLISKFIKIFTPFLVAIAIFLALVPPILGGNLWRFLEKSVSFLIISMNISLIMSLHLTYISGLILCRKNKIIVKESKYLENLIDCDYFYTDKTGTLTYGNFEIKDIIYYSEYKKNLILDYLYNLSKLSNHPIAKAIVENLRRRDNPSYFIASENLSGLGVWAKTYENEEIKIGSKDFVNIDENSKDKAVYMTINNILVCKIILEDKIKDDTKESIKFLKNQFLDIAVLSGDSEINVENLAKDLSISYAAELKSDDKFEIIKNEQKNDHKIIFVGDGDNDSQILKKANLGISMGQVGSNLSLEASDILISDKSYSKLKDLINIAKIVDKTAKKNLIFIIFAKILMIILAILGFGSMWLISLIEVSILLITILISLNILNKKI
ncbi:MAG: heavy metal translocating P-type ATPase [Anaerococcus hydrogenalis]|nr:heavy metal translocating P-type ATPase [Anaerococcus hydrogenalis]